MQKTGKKVRAIAIIIAIFAVGLLLYFKPLALSDLINENQEILVTRIEIGSKDGTAYNDSESYNNLTDDQKNNIINLFQQYSYKRTFATAFSDGSLSGLGDELIHIFVYEDNVLVNTISISSTGSISVNDKSYILKNSSELINELLEILAE